MKLNNKDPNKKWVCAVSTLPTLSHRVQTHCSILSCEKNTPEKATDKRTNERTEVGRLYSFCAVSIFMNGASLRHIIPFCYADQIN